jgi:hypothetical protein
VVGGGCVLFESITEETNLAISLWIDILEVRGSLLSWDFGYPEKFIVFLSPFSQMGGG